MGGWRVGILERTTVKIVIWYLKVKNFDLNLVGFRLVGESSNNSIEQKPEETELAGSNLLVVHKSLQMEMN